MAKLIGYLEYGHHAGTIHRLAHKDISAKLATWDGAIDTYLDKDGNAQVTVNDVTVYTGNVNDRKNGGSGTIIKPPLEL